MWLATRDAARLAIYLAAEHLIDGQAAAANGCVECAEVEAERPVPNGAT